MGGEQNRRRGNLRKHARLSAKAIVSASYQVRRWRFFSTRVDVFFAEADALVATSAYDLTEDLELDVSGVTAPMFCVSNPSGPYPYPVRYKATEAVWVTHFRMRR